MGGAELLVVALLSVAFTAGRALLLGQDINWDLRNYHYYSVYAWLNHRVTYHLAPAQLQTWLNPLVFLPHYWLMNHVSPTVAGLLFGLFAAVDCILVYAIARLIILTKTRSMAVLLSLLAAAVGLSGPEFLANIGTTSSDITSTIPVLAGVLVLCWGLCPERNAREQYFAYAGCGVLLGLAAGLKLTAMTFVVGMALTLAVLCFRKGFGAVRFALYSAGCLLGFLVTGGYWCWFLWKHYSNPILPYYNTAFRSPWVTIDNWRDNGAVPRKLLTGISYPFQWFIGLYPTSHAPLRDARFALLSVLLPLCLLAVLWRVLHKQGDNEKPASQQQVWVHGNHFWLLLLFGLFSYVLWIRTFAIYRYLLPLDLISGLILLLVLDQLITTNRLKLFSFVLLALFSIGWSKPSIRERIPYRKESWFDVQLPPAVSTPNTIFVVLGHSPLGYLVPYLPTSDRVVRINGNMPIRLDTRLGQETLKVVSEHAGPIRSLAVFSADDTDKLLLSKLGLVLDETRCDTIRTSFEAIRTCPITKSGPGTAR